MLRESGRIQTRKRTVRPVVAQTRKVLSFFSERGEEQGFFAAEVTSPGGEFCKTEGTLTVSYTHLTLPTIRLV